MSLDSPTPLWQPVARRERYAPLDVVRGLALLGVLLVNAVTLFRAPLLDHILQFHSHPGWADRLTDVLLAGLVEFKAFALFSFLFGVGSAIQADRSSARGVG